MRPIPNMTKIFVDPPPLDPISTLQTQESPRPAPPRPAGTWELEDKSFLKIDIICLDDSLKYRIMAIKGLFTWSGGPRSSGVSFFCFVSPRA